MEEAVQQYNQAIEDFRTSLKPELERKIFDSLLPPSSAAETVAVAIDLDSRLATILDRRHFAKAHPALKSRLEAFQKYAPIIEVFISSNPALAALVWGGVKLVLKCVLGFLEPFEKILDTSQEIANTLPRIEIYQKFADRRSSVQSALDVFHIDLVTFFTASVRFLKRHGFRALIAHVISNSGPSLDEIAHRLKNDAHQIDLLLAAIGLDAAAEDRTQNARRGFLQWLNAEPENDGRLSHAKSLIHPGTCSWIFSTEEYLKWAEGLSPDFVETDMDDPTPILEIQGEEGCGKTVLAASLADSFQAFRKNQKTAFGYYFHGSERIHWDNRHVLACLIAQMLRNYGPGLPEDVIKHFEESYNMTASEHECYDLLETTIQLFDSIIVLIDHHSSHGHEINDILSHLMRNKESNRTTSNRIPRTIVGKPGILFKGVLLEQTNKYSTFLRKPCNNILELNHQTETDKNLYLRNQANKIASLQYDIQEPRWRLLSDKIVGQLSREPMASFLLLSRIVEYLRVQTNARGVEFALDSLSPDVRQIYSKAFEHIQSFEDSRTQLGYDILQWVSFSFRPLRISEIAEAITVESGCKALEPAKRHSNLEHLVRSICGPFISISDGYIHAAHQSINLFLEDVRVDNPSNTFDKLTLTYVPGYSLSQRHGGTHPDGFRRVSRNRITRACIAYLSLECFSNLPSCERMVWAKRHPFFDYAVHCWLHHILDLANIIKNPTKGYRVELCFDGDLLKLIRNFLTLPQAWTYLEGLVVFSSVREARESLESHMWPVRELAPFMDLEGRRDAKGEETRDADLLESWMKAAIDRLGSLQDITIAEALSRMEGERSLGLSFFNARPQLPSSSS